MRPTTRALIATLVLEAVSLCAAGIGYAVGDVSYKTGIPDHLLFQVGLFTHLPGVILAAMVGLQGAAFVITAIVVTVFCWFLFWLMIYQGLAGARGRWGHR